MEKVRILALILCLSLLCACSGATGNEKKATVVEIGKDPLPCSEEELYQQLFDPNNRVEIEIHMPESELQKLQQDFDTIYKSPIYRKADMTITITAHGKTTQYIIPEVGVRMKGNTSRTAFYSEEEGIYNAIHLKIDFQETFDNEAQYADDVKVWESKDARKVRKSRTFATLEKLEMRWNKCCDSTYLRESYGYEIFRSQGVLAPQVSLCSLDWSGVHMGVYTLSEPVDEAFLEKRLPQEALGGDLYKLSWGADFRKAASIGVEDELAGEFYTYDLKTNKKTSQHEALKKLIANLNSGVMTKERFGELVDAQYFVKFAAVSYLLGNPDDLRSNYNNCYVYFRPDNGKAIFIPYDYDRCLGVTYEWNPYGDGMVDYDPFSLQQVNGRQNNPLFLFTVTKDGFYTDEYVAALHQLTEDPLLQIESFAARFKTVSTIYGGDTQPSVNFANGYGRNWGFSLTQHENMSFDDYITAKLETLMEYLYRYEY